jgi:hypothetical protein
MRAKFINENIKDFLKPKSEKEINKLIIDEFKKKNGVSIEEAQKIVDDLNIEGAKAILVYKFGNTISNRPINISMHSIFPDNSSFDRLAKAPTLNMANKIVDILNSCSIKNAYRIVPDDYINLDNSFDINGAINLLEKIKIFNEENVS